MVTVNESYTLKPGERLDPLIWLDGPIPIELPTYSDDMLNEVYGGKGRIRSWGHDDEGVHWLTTRRGTTLHRDPAYTRYTHHLLLRNDGFRLRGLLDDPDDRPQLVAGHLYCLDTHSPHQVTVDTRFQVPDPVYKFQLAVDRDQPLQPAEALNLLVARLAEDPLLTLDTMGATAPRWKPKT
jgi:hypothetical protein